MPRKAGLGILPVLGALALVAGACGDSSGPGDGNEPEFSVSITQAPAALRQGDVAELRAEVRRKDGTAAPEIEVTWSLSPPGAGFVNSKGRLVGYAPGAAKLIAQVQGAADTVPLTIEERVVNPLSATVVGRGVVSDRFTSDLWVHGGYAYTGTWGQRNGLWGDRLYVWDVSTPSSPVLVDSVVVNARTVNDIKVRADGRLAVLTHEGSADGLNGITILDLSDPAHPATITRFTRTLESGVHNVWIEGDCVYAAVDGEGDLFGLRVIDISDPANPKVASSFYGGLSFVHDVYVRDGLAFVSHWDAGLIILDVGNGIAGGSPQRPVEVSRILIDGGQTHNAWYWPASGYVFVGEEDFSTPGIMHVIDLRDLTNPIEVASFLVPGNQPPHNFWIDEEKGIAYLAWYGNGIRALDVAGDLLGQLHRQNRELVGVRYGSSATMTWAPQLVGDLLFLADMNTGLWVLKIERVLGLPSPRY
ncbi:MAG: hypothetical protein KatS3mg081_0235 [Gemmatimonadales bacterium]|nr:MAG: hypothetical protein KatS3mg081_0235 [Gemmatimonadales bacterium]